MSGNIFITGGAGFVGSAIIDELIARNYAVNAITNRRQLAPSRPKARSFPGGLFDAGALDAAIAGCSAVIHVVGIIRENPSQGITFRRLHVEATQAVLAAAARQGIRRYIHMSAQGSRADGVSEYHKTKWAGEEAVRGSGLDWTIFRPSMIHGPRGEFMEMEAKWARKKAMPFLFMPYFGAGVLGLGGAGLIQPVWVNDVARAFVDAIENPKTIGQTYALGGAQVLTWPKMHRLASRSIVGHARWVMPIPAWYARLLTKIVPASLLPFNRDQVIMSQEDNRCEMGDFGRDFGWEPMGFADALVKYVTTEAC